MTGEPTENGNADPSAGRDATETDQATDMTLKVTGERFHPENLGEIRQEHMHRYAWTSELVADKRVVDIASGEGFGSAMLAENALHVTGIDRDRLAVSHATRQYAEQTDLEFICADAAATGLDDKSADVVVSFETIEHVADQPAMLAEIDRILRDDGFLVISSPNRSIYSDRQNHDNPFHTRELNRDEFLDLLGTRFPNIRLYGQRLAVASALLPDTPEEGTVSLFHDTDKPRRRASPLSSTMYFVAVAARSDTALPRTIPSMLVADNEDIYWRMRDHASELHRLVEQLSDNFVLRRDAMRMIAASASKWFDAEYYREQGGSGGNVEEALSDYLARGEARGLRPCHGFDPGYYYAENPDVAEAGQSALMHFVFYGEKEGRLPAPDV